MRHQYNLGFISEIISDECLRQIDKSNGNLPTIIDDVLYYDEHKAS